MIDENEQMKSSSMRIVVDDWIVVHVEHTKVDNWDHQDSNNNKARCGLCLNKTNTSGYWFLIWGERYDWLLIDEEEKDEEISMGRMTKMWN